MNLHDLMGDLGLTLVQADAAVPIVELTDDSRQVQPGWLFVARSGTKADGKSYIADAIARGAAAIVADQPPATRTLRPDGKPVAWVVAPQVDQALASALAGNFFGHPSHKLSLVGVTGTNGKTTTTYLVQHLLAAMGVRCGVIGTVIIDDGATRHTAELTTPGAIELQRLLATMVKNGCEAAAAEISSHALHQGRAAHLRFAAAVFTNLTGDHLDYHGTMDQYAAAKAILFKQLGPEGWAILNADDTYSRQMRQAFAGDAGRLLWCTLQADAAQPAEGRQCSATVLELGARYSQARFDGPWGSVEVKLPLVGRHNVANTLQAIAAANVVRSVARTLREALESVPLVPGRLQPVLPPHAAEQLPAVLVDYAHTHDALENVLNALRPVTRGKLVCLFGCGGDRDRTKRPKMAAVACRLADRVVITSDNPRTEQPQAIIAEILAGVPKDAQPRVTVEADRGKAIALAIRDAQRDDVVLLAGKGHEDYQIIGTQKRLFDDREEAAAALRSLAASRAPAGAGT